MPKRIQSLFQVRIALNEPMSGRNGPGNIPNHVPPDGFFMSDALNLLLTRRSIPAKNLGEPGPDAETLRTLLTAAARVPDHGKLVPWRFIVFTGEARATAGDRLAELWAQHDPDADAERLALERSRFSRTPVVVGIVSCAKPHVKIPEWEQVLSAGAVCMTLLTAAHAAGYSAQWLSEWYAFDEAAGRTLGLVDDEKFAGFVHIGTALEPPYERARPNMDAIISHWSEPH